MNLKSKRGYTTADVVVAILIIVVFAGIMVTLYQNYSTVSKEVERKSKATVELIEEIKQNDYEYFNEENELKDKITVYDNEPIEEDTAYSKTVTVEDYSVQKEDAVPGLVKNVYVTVSYKLGNETQSVELSTIISKE